YRVLVAQHNLPVNVRDGDAVKTLAAGLSVFRIGDDGKLTIVRKYDIDVGDKTMFWREWCRCKGQGVICVPVTRTETIVIKRQISPQNCAGFRPQAARWERAGRRRARRITPVRGSLGRLAGVGVRN